jgi:divalent metal cation (Fe/Co/Zn/Cd) transporter
MTYSSCAVCLCGTESCEPCTSPGECANCATCCCSEQHIGWRRARISQALRLEYLSVGWMSVEVAGALFIGLISLNFALVAFGADSLVELLSASVVVSHLRKDSAGEGHLGEREAFFSALLLVALIPVIAIPSTYYFLVARAVPEFSPYGLAIAAAAIVIMPILWLRKRKIGRDTNCLPLTVDAAESATCFFMAIAVFVGLLAQYALGIAWADYAATLVILAFVAREAFESFHEFGEQRRAAVLQP